MAEFAQKIVPDHWVERNAGCITIDNERYLSVRVGILGNLFLR